MVIVSIAPLGEDNCRFSVRFEPMFDGPEMEFRCREIEVANVAP